MNCMKNDNLMLQNKYNFDDSEKTLKSFLNPDMQIRFKQCIFYILQLIIFFNILLASNKDNNNQILDNNINLNSKITITPGIKKNYYYYLVKILIYFISFQVLH